MEREQRDSDNFARLPEAGDVVEGRYRLDSIIATGGMGIIMRAKQLNLDRDVAVKLLHPHRASDPETAARFEREVNLAKDLNHPHTIQVIDVGRTAGDTLYLVMELLEGRDLGEIVADEGPLSVGRALDLAGQALDGIAEAHEHDVIHRDLKPSNIFVHRDRRGGEIIKVLDFGIAKSLGTSTALTGTRQVCGTVEYMPPEALLERDATKSADVYAMGLILAEMLYGGRVFEGDSAPKTMLYQINEDLPIAKPFRDTSLERLLRKATVKDPDARFHNADEMLEVLESTANEMSDELQLRPAEVPQVEAPSQSEVAEILAVDDPAEAFLSAGEETGPQIRPEDVLPGDTSESTDGTDDTAADSTESADSTEGESSQEPSSTPESSPLGRPEMTTPEELKKRSEKELVGGFSAVIVDNLDNSLLWAVLGISGAALAFGVAAFVVAPGSLGLQAAGGEPANRTAPDVATGAPSPDVADAANDAPDAESARADPTGGD